MTIISLIVAMDETGLIGNDNKLPWKIPQDMAWFRSQTLGKPIIMGRKTHESIGMRLPDRLNIVISNNKNYKSPHDFVYVYNSLKKAIDDFVGLPELVIIGGAKIYKVAFNFVTKMYITKIHEKFNGDVYFPKYSENDWEIKSTKILNADDYTLEFKIMEKVK
jgi:dihydrofolate reductase